MALSMSMSVLMGVELVVNGVVSVSVSPCGIRGAPSLTSLDYSLEPT